MVVVRDCWSQESKQEALSASNVGPSFALRKNVQIELFLNRRGGQRHPADFQGLLPFLRTEVFGPDAWDKKETFFSPEGSASVIRSRHCPGFHSTPKENYQVIVEGLRMWVCSQAPFREDGEHRGCRCNPIWSWEKVLSSYPRYLLHIPDENAANTNAEWPTGLHVLTHMHSVGRIDIDDQVVFVHLRPN